MTAQLTGWIRAGLLLAIVPLGAAAQPASKEKRPSTNFAVHELAPRVWAAIHNDQYGKAICNAGIIDLGDRTLVFDPFMTPSAATELRKLAESLTGRTVSMVVNSHFHNDHIRGNQAFLPQATIVSSTITRNYIERWEPEEQDWDKKHAPALLQAVRKRMINASGKDREELPYWIGYYEGMVESADELIVAVPDYTFDDSLWIRGSKLEVKLVETRNAHTASDVVLLIPSLGIAFMGDLLYHQRHPWLMDGNVAAWKQALRGFYEDRLFHTYVPGHGAICTKDALKSLYEYLGEVQGITASAVSDSAQAAVMSSPIPFPYNTWFCGRFYHSNLRFLMNAAKQARH